MNEGVAYKHTPEYETWSGNDRIRGNYGAPVEECVSVSRYNDKSRLARLPCGLASADAMPVQQEETKDFAHH